MTEQPQKKICTVCRQDFPATEEFFYPSYLTSNGRNICKICHKERAKNSHTVTYRAQLRERATSISAEQVPLYKSLNSIATAVGLSAAVVEHDIFDRNLPVYSFIYNNTGPALALQMEDAEAYIREHAQNVHIPAVTPKKPEVMGRPDTCGCCNNDKGNILAVHNTDQRIVAYLCSTCYRAARSFDWEPERLRAVAKLIETIGGNIDRSRR
jgi:hypothetical protein